MTFVPERWGIGRWGQAHWDGLPGLDAVKSTVALTAAPVTLRVGRKTSAATGAILVTGVAALPTKGRVLAASKATLTVTRYPAQTVATRRLAVDAKSIVVTGNSATLRKITVYALTANSGALTFTGYPATLSRTNAYALTATAAVVTLGSNAAQLQWKHVYTLGAVKTALTLTGRPAALSKTGSYATAANTGTVTLTGYDAALIMDGPCRFGVPQRWDTGRWGQAQWDAQIGICASLTPITVTGYLAALSRTGASVLPASKGAIILNASPVILRTARKLVAAPGAIVIAGAAPLQMTRRFAAASSSITLTGYSAGLIQATEPPPTLSAITSEIVVQGHAVSLLITPHNPFDYGQPGVLRFGHRVVLTPGRW